MPDPNRIRALINRLARLDAAETWEEALNPAQIAALDYLARANRFSRAPSHVAEYLGTTRGTMSQTLKALMRKGFIRERRSDTDKRSISYDLTEQGRATTVRRSAFLDGIEALPETAQADLEASLSELLARQLEQNEGRPFGACRSCAHHRRTGDDAYCTLLSLSLVPEELDQICHEHVAAG